MQCICNTDLGSLFCKAYVIIVLCPQLYKSEVDNCGVFLCLAGAGAGPGHSNCAHKLVRARPSHAKLHHCTRLLRAVQCTVYSVLYTPPAHLYALNSQSPGS